MSHKKSKATRQAVKKYKKELEGQVSVEVVQQLYSLPTSRRICFAIKLAIGPKWLRFKRWWRLRQERKKARKQIANLAEKTLDKNKK
jgi:hypothetical protein